MDQLEEGDELIVIGDGEQDVSAETVGDFQPASILYAETHLAGSRFGNMQRDCAMQLAAGRTSHLLFIDDDDCYLPGALDTIRWAIGDDRTHAHIFKARWGPGHHAQGTVLWADQEVRPSNVATPMVVIPNRPYNLSWMDGNEDGRNGIMSDYAFLSAAIGECDGVRWHDSLIAVVRP